MSRHPHRIALMLILGLPAFGVPAAGAAEPVLRAHRVDATVRRLVAEEPSPPDSTPADTTSTAAVADGWVMPAVDILSGRATDLDDFALAAIRLNAAANAVTVEASAADVEDTATAVQEATAELLRERRIDGPPTFFEAVTAMAFELFRRAGVRIAVLEVGLGGRLDATNVVSPVVAAITSVDFDHEAQLGHTLESIAFEKAGIVKRGIPVVCGRLAPVADVQRAGGVGRHELDLDFFRPPGRGMPEPRALGERAVKRIQLRRRRKPQVDESRAGYLGRAQRAELEIGQRAQSRHDRVRKIARVAANKPT